MIWENLCRDFRGRRLRAWVYPVLAAWLLVGGLAGYLAVSRTARPPQTPAAPANPAARLSGCPADPGSFGLADPDYGEGAVFAGLRAEGRSRLDPPRPRWSLVRSLDGQRLDRRGGQGRPGPSLPTLRP